jgi:two-component system, response regulator YesN
MRVLIVEDEKTPREILRDFVPWASVGFDNVATARNGLEALEILEREAVDLILADVRMPKMDGVELAVEVRRRWPDCVLVFLSGYSDKEYLKTAIRVQAQDYLDKPIDLGRVEAAAARASTTIKERRQSREKADRGEKTLRELSPLRRQAQAQALFALGPSPGATIEERFSVGPLRALVLAPGAGRAPESAWAPAALALINGDGFPFPSFVAAPGPDSTIALACDSILAGDPASFNRAVEEILALATSLGPGLAPRIGISPSVPGAAELPGALAKARDALVDAFYMPSRRIYVYHPSSGRGLELREADRESLHAAMERGDTASIASQLELLEQRSLAFRDPDLRRVRSVWLEAASFLMNWVPGWGPVEREERIDKLREEIELAPSLREAALAARDCFERLFLRDTADLRFEDRVLKAKAFIQLRFADPDLTVDAIADYTGFSESYFCTVFKQTEGFTVKDYVTRFRIERAKAYLREKDPPTLADLALKVGFRDPNYFGTVFKRITGTTPGAYRNKALG